MKKNNLLIVDDEKKILHLLKEGLEQYKNKFQIAFTTNITQAKEIIDKFKVTTVLTDVKMPGGTGIDLLLYLKNNHPDVRVIIMTGYGNDDIKRSVLYSGAYAYISKPIEIKQLGRILINSFENTEKDDFIKNLSLFELLQFMNLSRYTGSVIVTATGDKKGVIFLVKGEIVKAEDGTRKNVDALTEIVSWKNSEISSAEFNKEISNKPIGSMQSILMILAKKVDESS